MSNLIKLLIQVEAINQAIKDAKHVQSLPTEVYGLEKLAMISDVRERFNALTVSLDWTSLQIELAKQATKKVA